MKTSFSIAGLCRKLVPGPHKFAVGVISALNCCYSEVRVEYIS
jgi:hypothetical protein